MPVITPEEEAAEKALLDQQRLEKRHRIVATLALMQSRWPALFPDADDQVRYPWQLRLRQAI